MNGHSDTIVCPACNARRLSLLEYESLMVLKPDAGLFALRCPGCHAAFSVFRPIPAVLREKVEFAAIQAGAGMGNPTS